VALPTAFAFYFFFFDFLEFLIFEKALWKSFSF